MIGVQGCGKSATANSIIGVPQHFKVSAGTRRCTENCAIFRTPGYDKQMVVVDTPPIAEESDINGILQFLSRNGVEETETHFVFIVRAGRFNAHEINMLSNAFSQLKWKMYKRPLLIFTNAAELDHDGDALTLLYSYISQSETLKSFSTKFDPLVFALDNVNWDSEKIHERVARLLCDVRTYPDSKCPWFPFTCAIL